MPILIARFTPQSPSHCVSLQCDTYTLDDEVVQVDVSDDGTTVAWCGAANETVRSRRSSMKQLESDAEERKLCALRSLLHYRPLPPSPFSFPPLSLQINGVTYLTPRAYGLDAQTGKLLFVKNLGINQPSAVSSVRVSSAGSYIAYSYGATVYVLTRTGTQRANVTLVEANIPAAISDDGTYLVAGAPSTFDIWAWTAATSSYKLVRSLHPAGTTAWYPTDFAFSDTVATVPGSAGDRALAAVAWMDGESLTVRVTMYNVSSGAVVADWTSATNAKLQNQAIIRLDGDMAAVACWGDSDDIPTVVVLQAGSNTPVFTAITPGSMFGVDIAVTSVNEHATAAVVVAAGKAVPANMFGNGGNAFAWSIVSPRV